jgi:hypothetical protein
MEADMNPLSIDPLRALGGVVIMVAVGFGAGWAVNGWRLHSDLAEQKAESADARAKSADAALTQLETRIKTMNESSTEARTDVAGVNVKLAQIAKELKNVQNRTPLDPRCRPDDDRVRSLREAVRATNSAIEGATSR